MSKTKQFYEDIDKYREIPITKILGVKDTGRRITIRCPFHQERTGSFNIFADGSYYCFGCAKGGKNAIDFCKDLGFSFKESLKELETYL